MKKRANNFTTKELKILAKDDGPVTPFGTEYSEYVEKLKKSMAYHGFDYEKLTADHGCDDIVHEDLWFEVSDMVQVLAWKILYERRLHRAAFAELREHILCSLNTSYSSNVDVDTEEIEEGDEEDYYDEFKFKSLEEDK